MFSRVSGMTVMQGTEPGVQSEHRTSQVRSDVFESYERVLLCSLEPSVPQRTHAGASCAVCAVPLRLSLLPAAQDILS